MNSEIFDAEKNFLSIIKFICRLFENKIRGGGGYE